MKKHFLFLFSAIVAMLMLSCSEEDIFNGHGGEAVTFNVSIPELSTRAIGDGTSAKTLYWGVYDQKNVLLREISNFNGQEFSSPAKVTLTLAKEKAYNVIFWAANKDNSMCTVDWGGRKMSVEPKFANQEDYDAFCSYETIDNVSGYMTRDVKLRRPFAQLNIGTADIKDAGKAGLTVENTKVRISGLPKTYDFVTGNTDDLTTFIYDLPKEPVSFEDEQFPVAGYEYLSMNYALIGKDKQLVDVTFSYIDDDGQQHNRNYNSVPLQRNWRTNIYGNILTSDADFTVMIEPEFEGDNQYEHLSIAQAQDLATALTSDKENIAVALTSDIELPVSSLGQQTGGSGEYKLGSENTKNISIDLNGHKLTFITTYWSVIGAKNADATITIKNGTVTSSQLTGTWNSYDMAFANCNYIIEDVTFEKAVAFESEGKVVSLKNVTINETHDYYAMWITAEGQTVNIDGLTIKSEGRGIKIDEQYVDAPAKVTLNIADAKFTTAKKAAIVVKSEAGADINLSNVNIAGVKADGINAVWVDEDSKDHADKVTVNGGSVVVEGTVATVATAEALQDALANNEVKDIYLAAGDYVLPHTAKGKTLSFIGTGNPEDVKITVTKVGTGGENCDYALDGSTVVFENITITTNSSTYIGYARCNGTYNNCVINGTYTLYGDSEFNGCTFNVSGNVYNLWTWGAPNAEFNSCTFNSDGKALLLYGRENTNLTVNGCTFNDNGGLSDLKAAIEIGNDYNTSYNVVVDNTTVNGYEINDKGINTGTTLWANKNSMPKDKLNVVVDGVDVY